MVFEHHRPFVHSWFLKSKEQGNPVVRKCCGEVGNGKGAVLDVISLMSYNGTISFVFTYFAPPPHFHSTWLWFALALYSLFDLIGFGGRGVGCVGLCVRLPECV